MALLLECWAADHPGIRAGTFTRVNEVNDATLGWVFFDLRPQLEGEVKAFLQ